MTRAPASVQPRGGPLVMLMLVLTAWTGARAVLWENPFAPLAEALDLPLAAVAPAPSPSPPPPHSKPARAAPAGPPALRPLPPRAAPDQAASTRVGEHWAASSDRARLSAGRQYLWLTAMQQPAIHAVSASGFGLGKGRGGDAGRRAPPFLAASPARPDSGAPVQRVTLDAWAFWRQGSDRAPVSQGRVPIYGASQIGSLLQYRLAARNPRDPRLYARAYKALVPRGESEVALGASLRPLAALPLRAAGELRYTDAAFADELRPAAHVVTEIAPLSLPFGTQMEAYGQAGWVGGAAATAFADGQASLTRGIAAVSQASGNDLNLSLGAAAWGGAQEDAQRIDIGPTMRLDLMVGAVPARISIDWRERVGGQAEPDSGLAATLSARF